MSTVVRLIRLLGCKLKQIGAVSHLKRGMEDDDVVLGTHHLADIEELLDMCLGALENYTGLLICCVLLLCF